MQLFVRQQKVLAFVAGAQNPAPSSAAGRYRTTATMPCGTVGAKTTQSQSEAYFFP